METVKRTIRLAIQWDEDLRETLCAFQRLCNTLSPICWNDGKPLSFFSLHKKAYHEVKGSLRSRLVQDAMRRVAACYKGKKGKRITQPVQFKRPFAVFYCKHQDSNSAWFLKDGTLSIWTINGRKRFNYYIPARLTPYFTNAISYDSLTVVERKGQLVGYLCVTLEKPPADGSVLVGIDRNETNLLVAVKETGDVFFDNGLQLRIFRTKHRKLIARLQRKLAQRKKEGKDTRSVRRLLRRLAGRQRNFTRTYIQTLAKRFVEWAGRDAILAFEQLRFKQGKHGGAALNRRLHQFPHGLLLRCIRNKAEMLGIPIMFVDPAHTSQTCARCGKTGERKRHEFLCPHCGNKAHADINAAINILNRAKTLLSEPSGESSGQPTTYPEAQTENTDGGHNRGGSHRLFCGDALTVLSEINEEVHLTVTSPPYYLSRGRGESPYGQHPQDIELLPTYEDYLIYLERVFMRIHELTVAGGRLCIVIDDVHIKGKDTERVLPTHAELICRLVRGGWLYKGMIIWKKIRNAHASGGAKMLLGSFPYPPNIPIVSQYEFILVFQKEGKRERPADREVLEASKLSLDAFKEWASTGIWEIPPAARSVSLPFNMEIPYRLIKMFSFVGDTVLDPFMGSGTTGVVAKLLRRNFIGIELYEHIFQAARLRIASNLLSIRVGKEG